MSLFIKKIACVNFRSYADFSLENLGNLTLIVGSNAVGKTNILEGIQLTTACTSFRHPKVSHLIRTNEAAGSFTSTFQGDGRELEVSLRLSDEGKTYYVNKKKKATRYVRGIMPSVLFCPDDLDLMKGNQNARRTQLDLLGSQLSSNYNACRLDYEKILRQKNSYLKQDMSHEYLSSVNDVLATIGSQLYCLRSHVITSLISYIQAYYEQLSLGKERIQISYVPSWERKVHDLETYNDITLYERQEAYACLMEAMEAHHIQEHESHRSLYGPHLDRIEFYINHKNTSLFASQGQQRSLVLSYKMAEVALMFDQLGQYPVLLLDDVMSELDNDRRAAFFSLVSSGVQTFITATNAEVFNPSFLRDARIVELHSEHNLHKQG